MLGLSILITLIFLTVSSVTDLRKREVPDFISYSFIAVALAYASALSVINSSFSHLLNSLLGAGAFFIIGSLLYYSKFFAGGDVKILTGIGACIGFQWLFIIDTLIVGGFYGLFYSIVLAAINFEKVKNGFRKTKIIILPFVLFALASVVIAWIFNFPLFYILAVISFMYPCLYYLAKIVEKEVLISWVSPDKLTEGDWLVKDVRVKGIIIKASFEGLSKKDLKLLQKTKKKVLVKYGIPFIPVFLIAFILEIFYGAIIIFLLNLRI